MANTVIGRVVATEKNPTTIDNFTFWTDPELILNPFDIVKVQHVNNSFSYGVIEDIAHITDAASFLTNFISSDFGDVNAEENTLRVGMNYVSAKVVCNTENIYIPLQSNAKVMLATAEEINYALGLNDIRNPLVCGYLEMYDGTKGCEKVTLPVNLNSKFIIGPEGAHLNISGISGLASKTSYAMFLLKAIQDSYMKKGPQNDDSEDSVAFVLFNVKGKDLLAIDQVNDFFDERNPEQARNETFAKYEQLGLSAEPFKNDDALQPLFKENRGNYYFVGEVFAASRNLIPNSQRNYFNENETRVLFEDLLREYFFDVLHKLYYEANRVKNDYKRQEEYLSKVAEYQKKEQEKGFVNEEERQKLQFDIDRAKKSAEEARKRLDKLDSSDSASPLSEVRKSIGKKYAADALKKKAETTTVATNDDDKKKPFVTTGMSKLSRSERKLVGKILSIITDIAPKDIAEQIITKIKEEMR